MAEEKRETAGATSARRRTSGRATATTRLRPGRARWEACMQASPGWTRPRREPQRVRRRRCSSDQPRDDTTTGGTTATSCSCRPTCGQAPPTISRSWSTSPAAHCAAVLPHHLKLQPRAQAAPLHRAPPVVVATADLLLKRLSSTSGAKPLENRRRSARLRPALQRSARVTLAQPLRSARGTDIPTRPREGHRPRVQRERRVASSVLCTAWATFTRLCTVAKEGLAALHEPPPTLTLSLDLVELQHHHQQ